ncbi:MAG: hypothetical protein Q9169_005137 [Polycauliona sp. 2 TL-2023]
MIASFTENLSDTDRTSPKIFTSYSFDTLGLFLESEITYRKQIPEVLTSDKELAIYLKNMNRLLLSRSLRIQLDKAEKSTTAWTGQFEPLVIIDQPRIVEDDGYQSGAISDKLVYCCETVRIFRRTDGTILTTMTPNPISVTARRHNSPHSSGVVEQIWEKIRYLDLVQPDVDWLFAYILTELIKLESLSKPEPLNEMVDEIGSRVQEMRSRRNFSVDSVEMVREYVDLIDTISQIEYIGEQKLRVLEKFGQEAGGSEPPPMPESKSPSSSLGIQSVAEMIEDAMEIVMEYNQQYNRYLIDLKSGLDVIFELATIEQNALALRADKNNRAILVFTIVTIIFLPLSFFTSYFGMNLQGVADTDKSERYFWAVCGTSTALIVGLTVLFGFKERVWARVGRVLGRG